MRIKTSNSIMYNTMVCVCVEKFLIQLHSVSRKSDMDDKLDGIRATGWRETERKRECADSARDVIHIFDVIKVKT